MDRSHWNCCGGAHAGQEHAYSDTKHLLVLVDDRPAHRAEVRTALMSLYHIVEFDEPGQARDYMRTVQPGALLMAGSDAASLGLVAALRQKPKYAKFPMLLILEDNAPQTLAAARGAGASGWVIEPYRRSGLIKLVSGRLNASLEAKWDRLPELQARALKGTVELFNSLSDGIEKGEPILYGTVDEVCSPLVEAVNSDSYKGILNGVREHDNYTYAHSLRVAVFLALFGRAIGLPERDQRMLTTGGLLHDVGKMFIPHLVLNKPGRLTAEEFEVMKGHVAASIRVLKAGDNIPKGVITIAGQHHEKLDGTGYPRGLKGAELNELARMAAIVDVFSALTDRRVYKPPMPPEQALAIMADEMAHHLDTQLLARFCQMLLDAAVEV